MELVFELGRHLHQDAIVIHGSIEEAISSFLGGLSSAEIDAFRTALVDVVLARDTDEMFQIWERMQTDYLLSKADVRVFFEQVLEMSKAF